MDSYHGTGPGAYRVTRAQTPLRQELSEKTSPSNEPHDLTDAQSQWRARSLATLRLLVSAACVIRLRDENETKKAGGHKDALG